MFSLRAFLSTIALSTSLVFASLNFPALANTTVDQHSESPSVSTQAATEEKMPIPIGLSQGEKLLGQPDVYFFDVNTPDIWKNGHVPGAIYINQVNWQRLLPDNKQAILIFYCTNRLCLSSFEAAKQTLSLGYEHVYTMPEGIHGWMNSGREVEKEE